LVKQNLIDYVLNNVDKIIDLLNPNLKGAKPLEVENFINDYISHVGNEGVCIFIDLNF
jgi:hypothetical protein